MIAGFEHNSYRGQVELTHVGQAIGRLALQYYAQDRACDHNRLSIHNLWPKWPPDRFTD